jgi:hypothetical protein
VSHVTLTDRALAAHLSERDLATLKRITGKLLAAVAPEQPTH